MRGTGSHDVEFTDVFVPADKVLANRPYGVVDPPLQAIISNAFPVITAVYLGVAESARDHAVAAVAGTPKADDPSIQRMVGLMDHYLHTCGWVLDGALSVVGDDPAPSHERVAAVMSAKRTIATAGVEVCDLAMEVAGGQSFYRTSPSSSASATSAAPVPSVHAGADTPPRRPTGARPGRLRDLTAEPTTPCGPR